MSETPRLSGAGSTRPLQRNMEDVSAHFTGGFVTNP